MNESEIERRQRQAVQRVLQQAMPDISGLISKIARQPGAIADIGSLYTPKHQAMLESISRSVARIQQPASILTPNIQSLAAFEIPALKLDYASLFPDYAAINAKTVAALTPSIRLIQDIQRQQFSEIIAKAQAAFTASLPPNWQDENITLPHELDVLLLDEGLALAWIPPSTVVRKLFLAESARARRKIIGDRWITITRACIAELDSIQEPNLAEHVDFARESGFTLLAGRHIPAQALSANLLDTVLRDNFDSGDRKRITGRRERLNIDEYPLRVALVLGGIWGSFGEFWTSKGDKVPREYTRHASAHGVSRRQYSRINSVLALMHVVSLLKLLDTDLKDANWRAS